MLVIGYDLETTGLDVANDRITEIGAVLWDTVECKPIKLLSRLVWDESYPKLSPEINKLTGITDELLSRYAVTPKEALTELSLFIQTPNLCGVVAHNGKGFDFPLLKNEYLRNGLTSPDFHPIDTSVDIPYPSEITTRKLIHLAAEHGFLNPFAHRALFDVMTMLSVFSKYDAQTILSYSRQKDLLIRAVVTYEDRELAKTRGFRWNGEKKNWEKIIKESQLESEMKASFKVIVLEEK